MAPRNISKLKSYFVSQTILFAARAIYATLYHERRIGELFLVRSRIKMIFENHGFFVVFASATFCGSQRSQRLLKTWNTCRTQCSTKIAKTAEQACKNGLSGLRHSCKKARVSKGGTTNLVTIPCTKTNVQILQKPRNKLHF